MLEVLQGLIQQHGQDAVVNNPAVPNEHNDAVMQDVLHNVMGGLQNHAGAAGGLGGLLSSVMGGGGQAAGGGLGGMLGSVLGGGGQSAGGGLGGMLGSVLGGGGQQAGGGLGGMLGSVLGGGGGNSNPIVGAIEQQVLGSLMAKFGLSNSAAGSVVAGMVPQILGGLLSHPTTQQAAQQQGGDDSMGGLGSLLGGLFGK
jgi:hypothetical protein